MDKYRIDSHKLVFHVGRVHDWMQGKSIYPVYLEISPSGSCNHRCTYCALDFLGYPSRFLDAGTLKKRLFEMGKLGVKSIMYAGEGEPLLHREIAMILRDTRKAGIDTALTTNGVLFDKKLCDASLAYLSWIKVSINAGRKYSYAKIHRTKEEDFDRVIKNMSYAASLKRSKGVKCALGMQIVLLPENHLEISLLAKKAKAIGMDYLVVKPYSQHPLSLTKKFKDIKYGGYLKLAETLQKFNDDKFNVIFRGHAMNKWDRGEHLYQHCLALPFWAYMDSAGGVWACSIYLTKAEFCLGNIYENTFKEIWGSQKRKKLEIWAKEELDTASCRVNCRMDEANNYLWELTHPAEHVNFI